MKKTKGTKGQNKALVLGRLEGVSSRIFSKYSRQLTDLVGKQHGVYALYKGNRLYYVGLATNLRRRIKQHLKDKHAKKWDKFSAYLVHTVDHIKEIESIILRVADPAGNTARGSLPKAVNLISELDRKLKEEQDRERGELVGVQNRRKSKPKPISRSSRKASPKKPGDVPTLASHVKKGFAIRAEYKGKTYRAKVYRSGTIKFAGKFYNSPTSAGIAIRGRTTNGWKFWRFRDKNGEWVKLDKLRR